MRDLGPAYVLLRHDRLDQMLHEAARAGAEKALVGLGLAGEQADQDLRDLRALAKALRLVRRTAGETVVRTLTTALLLALAAGIALAV